LKKTLSIFLLFIFFTTSAVTAKTIRVGWFNAPGLQDGYSEAELSGYNYEYLKKIQSYTGWDYEFIFKPWKECEQMLIDGEIDIIGDVAITEDRLNKYYFNDEPQGYSNMLLVCKNDNDKYYFGDFDSFDNISIASITSEYRTSLIEEISKKYGFSYTIKYFDTHDELFEAIDNDVCDAAIFSNVNEFPSNHYKIIYKSRKNGFYFIVNKESKDILRELNLAMQQISINNQDYNDMLSHKYFSELADNMIIAYSKSDLEYLETDHTINLFVKENLPPYFYSDEDTKEWKGIIPSYYNLISKKTGLKFNFIDINEAGGFYDGINSGKADGISMIVNNFNLAQEFNVTLSTPLFQVPKGFVRYINNNNPIETVAYLKNTLYPEDFNSRYKMVEKDSLQDMLYLVYDKEIDAAFMPVSTFNIFDQIPNYRNLYIITEGDYDVSLALADGKTDSRLFSVMEKAIGNITADELNEIIDENSTYSIKPSFLQTFEANKSIIVLVLILILSLFAIIIMQNRVNKLKAKHNKDLEDALEKAKASDEAKSLFLLSMSHDLRTPMNSIMGNSEIALENISNPKSLKSSLNDINQSSKILLNMINELLALSDIENDEIKLNNEPFNVRNNMVEIFQQTEISTKQKGLEFKSNIDIIHDSVIGDSNKFKLAIEKIVENSVAFCDKGLINISIVEHNVDERNSIYRLTISDTGVGMTQNQVDKIFEKFYTANSSKSYKTGGIGIGLNITKGILDEMKAKFNIQSEPKKGTTVTVEIPFKFLKLNEVDNEPKIVTLDLSDKRILVVEDIEINIKILLKMLDTTSINIVVARNGKDALDKFSKDDNFDIIFMDLQMPIMDGYEATRRIREIGSEKAKNIPIIAVSANAFDNDVSLASEVGMNEHFPKPISLDRLIVLLKKYLINNE
jgi:signal transduction histidine kinase/CheY-like chemotaxis protein